MAITRSVTLITAFEVPPGADDRFITGWERARDVLAKRNGLPVTALHRALRPDVDFRFVDVAPIDSPQMGKDAISDLAFPGGELPFDAHPGLYELVREDGEPDTAGGVVRITAFEVPSDADDGFLAGWDRARDVAGLRQGYLGARLHRSLDPADLRFVEIARWSSPLMVSRALRAPEFEQAADGMPFPAHAALYQVVRDRRDGAAGS